mmetsp:Transcript_14931/g.16157  ORF Transcript_14931/g.16157 Transcript_14931/m.16157 type:complete len:209 (-) Transcript_14931:86-712(-)
MGGSSSKEAKVVQESARAVLARRNIQPSPPPPSYGAPDIVRQSTSSGIQNSVPPSPSMPSTTSATNLPNKEAQVQSTSQPNEQVGFEMKKDILAEISKWQVKSETTKIKVKPLPDDVNAMRIKLRNEIHVLKLTPLGSPAGKLTEENLHLLFRELRDNPQINHQDLARKYYLKPETIKRLTAVVKFPQIIPDPDEPGLMIAVVKPFRD